ncbi:hypothetical protein BJ166DRAFT_616593 [Pestalotiopsis sp. NC0098]|nr:hypothetical protein BJ166DRAFT_616593 [Pestalotiopsis sp. NC0098]
MNVRVPEQDLDRINRTSIPLLDDQGGYLVALDVYHELHCLNMLRRQIYRDWYPDRHTMEKQLEHADHCIDALRQALMCHGDIALMTYDWIDDYRWPWPNFNVDHECRRWDLLEQWSAKHSVKSVHGPILQHPVLGKQLFNDIAVSKLRLWARRLVQRDSG